MGSYRNGEGVWPGIWLTCMEAELSGGNYPVMFGGSTSSLMSILFLLIYFLTFNVKFAEKLHN